MINYDEFKKNLIEEVEKQLAEENVTGLSVRNDEIMAPDGMTDRMIVAMEGSNISMAYRFQEIYKDFDGDYEEKAAELVDSIKAAMQVRSKEANVKEFITNFDLAKSSLMLRLIPGGSPALAETPHELIGDMALVVKLDLEAFSDANGRACCVVNDGLMGTYGIDKDELFKIARENSIEKESIKITPMGNMIASLMPDAPVPSSRDDVAFVATNQSGFHGASVIGYPDFGKLAAEKLGGSFYIIPSSVHEFILIKDDGRCGGKNFNNMIKDVNDNVLDPRDILSYQAYHYDAKEQLIEVATDYEARVNDVEVDQDVDEDMDI